MIPCFRTILALALPLAALCVPTPGTALAGEVPGLPPDVSPPEPAMQAKLKRLKEAAEKYRGLRFKQDVAVGELDKPALRTKILKMFEEELPPDVLNPLQRSLKQFGLIPASLDLNTYFPELYGSQVGGFYDPERKYLVLVKHTGPGEENPLEKLMGAKMAERADEMVMVHELTHALQDQHFNLKDYGHDTPLSDAALAKLALIEGDATLHMYSYFYNMDMDKMPMLDQAMQFATENMDLMVASMPDLPGAKEIMEAPAYVRESLVFPYIQGLVFVRKVKERGGIKLLDHAFAHAPPRSSEQILHPEKYLSAERDDPILIELPDFAKLLPGFKEVSKGTWGEFGAQIVLREKRAADTPALKVGEPIRDQGIDAALMELEKKLKEGIAGLDQGQATDAQARFTALEAEAAKIAARLKALSSGAGAKEPAARIQQAKTAAEGWGGDAFAVYEKDDQEYVFWITEWDSTRDAQEFYNLAKDVFAGDTVARHGSTRVLIVRGALPAELQAGVLAAMQSAVATPPENKPLDYAALGLPTDEQATKVAQPANPSPAGGGQPAPAAGGMEGEVEKMLDSDAFQKMAEGAAKEMLGDSPQAAMVGEMLKDPAFRKMATEMAKKMLGDQKQQPKGAVAANRYSNPGMGLALDLPLDQGWKEISTAGMPIQPLVALVSPDRVGELVVLKQPLPMALPLENLAPMLEMGLKMPVQNFQKKSARWVKNGDQNGYEIEFSGTVMGETKHHLVRFYQHGEGLLLLKGAGSADAAAWATQKATLLKCMDSLEFGAQGDQKSELKVPAEGRLAPDPRKAESLQE